MFPAPSCCQQRVMINQDRLVTTFLDLVRKVLNGELEAKIVEEFQRASKTWQRPAEPDLIDDDADAVEAPRGIGHKQLALTYQPEVV